MTDEQIKKNASVYVNKEYMLCTSGEKKAAIKDFIAGAHSRDEEIDKLRNPWISIEERLPEEFQIVFVHMQGGSCDSAIYTNGVFRRDLQLKFGMKDDGYTLISWQQMFKSNITHWMPIPELNKGE